MSSTVAAHKARPIAGSARPLVVGVPGMGLSAAVPATALQLLEPVWTTASVMVPGCGEPAAEGDDLRPVALARRLITLLDGLTTGPVVLVGHSASCQIVTEVAATAPERVAALVLIGPTTDPRATTWPALTRRWLRTAAWERPGQAPTLVRDYHRTGLRSMVRLLDAVRRERIDRTARRVGCPVLVVRGRHDRICPADWASALATITPLGRAVTLPAGAHMVPLTHPAALATVITAFLGQACGAHTVSSTNRGEQLRRPDDGTEPVTPPDRPSTTTPGPGPRGAGGAP